MPSDRNADIEDWILRVMPDLHPIVNELWGIARSKRAKLAGSEVPVLSTPFQSM